MIDKIFVCHHKPLTHRKKSLQDFFEKEKTFYENQKERPEGTLFLPEIFHAEFFSTSWCVFSIPKNSSLFFFR